MKLVKFNNGKYGVRKFSLVDFGYVYLDLSFKVKSDAYWWGRGSHHYNNCQDTKEIAEEHYDRLTDKGSSV